MTDLKTTPTPSKYVVETVTEVKKQVARARSARLARGNINVQRGFWETNEDWIKKVNDHPRKLQYLVDTLSCK